MNDKKQSKLQKFAIGLILALGALPFVIQSIDALSGDIWSLRGKSYLKQTDVIRLLDSSTPDLRLYNGDLIFGGIGSAPSTTAGAYSGTLVPFYNASGGTMTEGQVVVASVTASTPGYGSITTALATTTVWGICAATVANGSVGWMRDSGWALVNTTGTVTIGDILVSTGVAGYAGRIGLSSGSTDFVGVPIGRAAENGTASGDQILVLLE